MRATIVAIALLFSVALANVSKEKVFAGSTVENAEKATIKRDHLAGINYPLGPKIVCANPDQVPCLPENDPLESSICCDADAICCQNRQGNFVSCAPAGGSCCEAGHSCNKGEVCCGYGCMPSDAECCFGDEYCPAGSKCPAEEEKYCQREESAAPLALNSAFVFITLLIAALL